MWHSRPRLWERRNTAEGGRATCVRYDTGGVGAGCKLQSLAATPVRMSYFADLTPHTYTESNGLNILNIGWLDAAHAFLQGETPQAFREALRLLCRYPVKLHRGYHYCQFCPRTTTLTEKVAQGGNGQIRILA